MNQGYVRIQERSILEEVKPGCIFVLAQEVGFEEVNLVVNGVRVS